MLGLAMTIVPRYSSIIFVMRRTNAREGLIVDAASLLSFQTIRGRARLLNNYTINEAKSTAIAETETPISIASSGDQGEMNKQRQHQIGTTCSRKEINSPKSPLIKPKQSTYLSTKGEEAAEQTAYGNPQKLKRHSSRNTPDASQQDNVSKQKALQAKHSNSSFSFPDTVSQIPELEGDTVVPPAIPEKSARRTLNLKRTGVIDGVQYPYTGDPIAQQSACDASSVYSRDTTASSTVFGSNFHYDEPNVLQPYLEATPLQDANTQSGDGDQHFSSSIDAGTLAGRTDVNEQQLNSTPWLSQEFLESWQQQLDSGHINDPEHKPATYNLTEITKPILQENDSADTTNKRRALIKTRPTTTSPSCPVYIAAEHNENDSTSPVPPRKTLFTTCSANNPSWIPPLK